MAYVGAAVGVAQLGLTAYNTFAGDDGPKRKSLGAFDMAAAQGGAGVIRAAETTPGQLSSIFSPSSQYLDIKNQFAPLTRDIAALRGQVQPGFGRFTEAARQAIANARARAKGDIKDQLARRRLLGSSFGADALIRSEREFALLENQTVAQATLQEIATSAALIDQEFKSVLQQIQVELSELNMAQNFATALLTGANAAQLGIEKLLQAEAAGKGQGAASLFSQAQSLINGWPGGSGGFNQSADTGGSTAAAGGLIAGGGTP